MLSQSLRFESPRALLLLASSQFQPLPNSLYAGADRHDQCLWLDCYAPEPLRLATTEIYWP